MTNPIKILFGIFVMVAILIGGFFIYNQLLAPKKPVVPVVPEKPEVLEEKLFPKLIISTPSELEVVAYKASSFNFSIENEKEYPEARNVNVTLRGVTGDVSPNDVSIASGESKNFEVKLDKLEPGNYTLYLEIKGIPDVNISKVISLKSQIVVGLDDYHTRYPGSAKLWGMEIKQLIKSLNEKNIKTKVIESQFTPEILENINVLIIAKPRQPILISERQELKNFLNQSGGLLLAGCGYDCPNTDDILNDLTESLHLEIKFNDIYHSPRWTMEIIEHQITSGIEAVYFKGGSLDVEIPLIALVKEGRNTVYAIQYYAKGKIGAIGDYKMLRDEWIDSCNCLELNLNLIKWLATPPTPKELEEMG